MRRNTTYRRPSFVDRSVSQASRRRHRVPRLFTSVLAAAAVLQLALPGFSVAAQVSDRVDWVATCDVSPTVALGLFKLIDDSKFWPCNLNEEQLSALQRNELNAFVGSNQGDYVTGAVYLDDEGSWVVTDSTRIVLVYVDEESGQEATIESLDVLFARGDLQEGTTELVDPKQERVVLTPNHDLVSSRNRRAPIIWVRFEENALPRGGFAGMLGWRAPDEVRVVETGTQEVTKEGGDRR